MKYLLAIIILLLNFQPTFANSELKQANNIEYEAELLYDMIKTREINHLYRYFSDLKKIHFTNQKIYLNNEEYLFKNIFTLNLDYQSSKLTITTNNNFSPEKNNLLLKAIKKQNTLDDAIILTDKNSNPYLQVNMPSSFDLLNTNKEAIYKFISLDFYTPSFIEEKFSLIENFYKDKNLTPTVDYLFKNKELLQKQNIILNNAFGKNTITERERKYLNHYNQIKNVFYLLNHKINTSQNKKDYNIDLSFFQHYQKQTEDVIFEIQKLDNQTIIEFEIEEYLIQLNTFLTEKQTKLSKEYK